MCTKAKYRIDVEMYAAKLSNEKSEAYADNDTKQLILRILKKLHFPGNTSWASVVS